MNEWRAGGMAAVCAATPRLPRARRAATEIEQEERWETGSRRASHGYPEEEICSLCRLSPPLS